MNGTVEAETRVAIMGLGPIGLGVLRSALENPRLRVVAAVDVRDDIRGRDVGDVAGVDQLGVTVAPTLASAGPVGTADVVLHCTGSRIASVAPQIIESLEWGAGVVSTCEELSFPWYHHPDDAAQIDAAAQRADRTVLGTGVNPGFAMDAFALAVSGAAGRIDGVRVHRVVDAAVRRGPLQAKVGAGITKEEFERRKAEGRIGHVGLPESVAMIAAGFGWRLDRIEGSLEPAIASEAVTTDAVRIPAGAVTGILEEATGWVGRHDRVHLRLEMYVGAPDPRDTVHLEGDPPLRSRIDGLHGDLATAAIVVNGAIAVGRLASGLRTMLDAYPLRASGRRTA